MKYLFLVLMFSFAAFGRTGSEEIARQLRQQIELKFNKSNIAGEKIILPVTRGFPQGLSNLCWTYATLNMLESHYLSRFPHSKLELSRATLQYLAMEDRLKNTIAGTQDIANEGGLEIEALKMMSQNGMVHFTDYHDIISFGPAYSKVRSQVMAAAPADKLKVLKSTMSSVLKPLPDMTHVDSRSESRLALGQDLLDHHEWVELFASEDKQGWFQEPDPDSRPNSMVYFTKRAHLIEAMKASLKDGFAFTWGTTSHAMMIYGADFDQQGEVSAYYIKDSYAPFFYKASASDLHARLVEVTLHKKYLP